MEEQKKVIEELIYRVKIANYMAQNHLNGLEPDFDIMISGPLYELILNATYNLYVHQRDDFDTLLFRASDDGLAGHDHDLLRRQSNVHSLVYRCNGRSEAGRPY